MSLTTHTVAPGAAGTRLDVYLADATAFSRSYIAKLAKSGAITVNDKVAKSSQITEPEDIIKIDAPEHTSIKGTASVPDLPIVYEDDDLIVVNKPAGIPAHGGAGQGSGPTVAAFAQTHSTDPDPERPGIIHRLDKDTSGLMMIAKSAEAKATMQAAFKAHAVHKTYLALVIGRLEPETAVIKLPLARDPAQPLRQAVVASGREAITKYHVEATYPGYSLVCAEPATGRTHQLRVHFAAVGHPIAGDTQYGLPKAPTGLSRQFLHATKLEFTAPSGARVQLECPLPDDLNSFLTQLGSEVAA